MSTYAKIFPVKARQRIFPVEAKTRIFDVKPRVRIFTVTKDLGDNVVVTPPTGWRCFNFNGTDQYGNIGALSTNIVGSGTWSISLRIKGGETIGSVRRPIFELYKQFFINFISVGRQWANDNCSSYKWCF